MTVIDEKSRVPTVGEAELSALAKAFDREGVVAASLIGSQARGNAGPLSDIDLAVWHSPGLGDEERHRLRLELIGAAVETLGTAEIDLVLLNRAPPLVRHRAMRDGIRFLERDRTARVNLEARALSEYLDTEPLRQQLSQSLRRSIREGTFGRRSKR